MPTGATYHQYINPQRSMPQEAFAVHGLGDEFLRDKPVFTKIASDFVAFIGQSRLVIHNAAFDMKFLNAELRWADRPQIPRDQALDTLAIARKRFPGSPVSLDALCRRFNINNTARTMHGALLDSEILAEVYLELVGGRQPDLTLASREDTVHPSVLKSQDWRPVPRPVPLPSRVSEDELTRHSELITQLGAAPVWKKFDPLT
jgi:DNA polymerase-3 subunit epsilon